MAPPIQLLFSVLITILCGLLVYIFKEVLRKITEISSTLDLVLAYEHNFTRTIFMLLRKLNPEHHLEISNSMQELFAAELLRKQANGQSKSEGHT